MLSTRGTRASAPGLPYWGAHAANLHDLHDPATNPGGFVSMAIAENKLNFEAVRGKLSSCRYISPDTGCYSNFIGRPRTRRAFAAAMSRTLFNDELTVDPEQLCISAGCGSVIENIVFCLCDVGDGVILPTPTYAALYNDIGTLPGAAVIDCPTDADAFRLTAEALSAAFDRGAAEGHPPRVLLLLHPSNPLGTVYSPTELEVALAFCEARRLHLVCDEIYANSVFDASCGFQSIVELLAKRRGAWGVKDPSTAHDFLGSNVHVVWGLSKDFCMSGYRVGAVYTHSGALFGALSNVAYFAAVSNDTQEAVSALLEDLPWVDAFLASNRALLTERCAAVTTAFRACGLSCTPAASGMFVWLDARPLLAAFCRARRGASSGGGPAPAEECRPLPSPTWDDEGALQADLLAKARLLFTPGSACHAAEPGFFRCCYAWMAAPSVDAALMRLQRYAADLGLRA